MLKQTIEVDASFCGQPIILEIRLVQTNDAPVCWGLSIWDLETWLGPQRHRIFETLFGLSGGLGECLRAGSDIFTPASEYALAPSALEQIYELAVTVGAMESREIILPTVTAPGPRQRLSSLSTRLSAH